MRYIVKGNFYASLCRDFTEAISNTRIRVYQVESASNVVDASKSDIGYPHILTAKEIADKEHNLIGKGNTDSDGNYEIELSDNYQEESITIDIKITAAPGQKVTKKKPLQLTVQKLSPVWRDENNRFEYCYNYRFSFEFWNGIRTHFDAWVICGYLESSPKENVPIISATVSAFDADWIKDDFLGQSLTNSRGYFRIDFCDSDFKQTFLSPAINIETPISTIPTPGVYFKAVTADGTILYEEDRAESRSEE